MVTNGVWWRRPMLTNGDCRKPSSYLAGPWASTSLDVHQCPPRCTGGHWWPPVNFPPAGIYSAMSQSRTALNTVILTGRWTCCQCGGKSIQHARYELLCCSVCLRETSSSPWDESTSLRTRLVTAKIHQFFVNIYWVRVFRGLDAYL